MTQSPPISARLEAIYTRISEAKDASKLAREAVTLIAVSKGQPAVAIKEAIEAGQEDFGENRIQEILLKWPQIKKQYPNVRLHFIGALQTNKAEDAMTSCHAIHSIDRERLADAVKKAMEKTGTHPECFIQVNTGEEPQKGGVAPADAGALIEYCKKLGLPLSGLMCVPPAGENPAPHFGLLATIAQRHGLHKLSMGMSADFETAIAFGATHVRVGTAIFGERSSEVRSDPLE